MNQDPFVELAPLAALGALDGENRRSFEGNVSACSACQSELRAYEGVSGRIGLGLSPLSPDPAVRREVLRFPPAPGRSPFLLYAASVGIVALAMGWLITRQERDIARRDAAEAVQRAEGTEAQLRQLQNDLRSIRGREVQGLLWELETSPDSRVAILKGLKDAKDASGRVIFDPVKRSAVLIASGLPHTPQGKAYEMWVIGRSAPVAAGVFHVDERGGAVLFSLPVVEETARVKTFAVTLEPEQGTTAPTGPMVLAGPTS